MHGGSLYSSCRSLALTRPSSFSPLSSFSPFSPFSPFSSFSSFSSCRAITNDEPFTGAEGREFHIRDPDAREASPADGLDKGLDADRTDADRTDGGSPLREDKHSFASFNDFDDEPETTPGIIAAAREFAGDPGWADWELASPPPTAGMVSY